MRLAGWTWLVTSLVATATPAWAGVTVPALIGSNMVLQSGQPVRLWGRADPGEAVTVSFAGARAATTANEQGRWNVEFGPLKPTDHGTAVVVSSPGVPRPVAVRYAWSDNPGCNLYNRAGLPAVPFRTDATGDPY